MKLTPELARLILPYAQIYAPIYSDTFTPKWEDKQRAVHGFALTGPDGKPLIAFEGTTDFQEWVIDFEALPIFFPGHFDLGPVHYGFMHDVLSIVGPIAAYLESLGWPEFDVMGHSKGAGEAPLLAALLRQRGHAPRRVILLEPPRCGTWLLQKYLADVEIHATRTVNCHGEDIVTDVPTDPPFRHVKDLIELTVPDTDDLATKHRLPAVLAALLGAAA